jgi:hypothetical protein
MSLKKSEYRSSKVIGLQISDLQNWTSDSPIAIGLAEPIGQKGRFSLFSLYFFTIFCCSDEFFANFCENSRVVGISTVSGISAALGFAVIACVIAVVCAPANECVPDVAESMQNVATSKQLEAKRLYLVWKAEGKSSQIIDDKICSLFHFLLLCYNIILFQAGCRLQWAVPAQRRW